MKSYRITSDSERNLRLEDSDQDREIQWIGIDWCLSLFYEKVKKNPYHEHDLDDPHWPQADRHHYLDLGMWLSRSCAGVSWCGWCYPRRPLRPLQLQPQQLRHQRPHFHCLVPSVVVRWQLMSYADFVRLVLIPEFFWFSWKLAPFLRCWFGTGKYSKLRRLVYFVLTAAIAE